MEGMRGYAVFLVFLVHHHTLFGGYLAHQALASQISQFSHAIGNSGVDFFFVLSGFLIYGNLLKKNTTYATFLKKRVRRIYPTFLVVFCIHVALSHFVLASSKLPQHPAKEVVYLLQNLALMPGLFNIDPLVTVAWSLSYEFFFYLSIPLVITFTGMRGWRTSTRISFFASLLVLHWIGYELAILPHIRLSMFLIGILLFELANVPAIDKILSRGSEFTALGAYLIVLLTLGLARTAGNPLALNRGVFILWPILLGLTLPLIVMHSIRFNGILRWTFCSRPLRYLGNISYSYFLIHGLVLYGIAFVVRPVVHDAIPAPLFLFFMAANFLLTLLVSAALFRLVEWPYSLAVPASGRPAIVADHTSEALDQPKATSAGVS